MGELEAAPCVAEGVIAWLLDAVVDVAAGAVGCRMSMSGCELKEAV